MLAKGAASTPMSAAACLLHLGGVDEALHSLRDAFSHTPDLDSGELDLATPFGAALDVGQDDDRVAAVDHLVGCHAERLEVLADLAKRTEHRLLAVVSAGHRDVFSVWTLPTDVVREDRADGFDVTAIERVVALLKGV